MIALSIAHAQEAEPDYRIIYTIPDTVGPAAPPPDIFMPRRLYLGCEDIRGLEYESLEEREWFLAECIKPEIAYVIYETSTVQEAFIAGWRYGGGIEAELPLVLCIIGQESGWQPQVINHVGPFYGLGQFLWSTWESVGGGDWQDPWTQGENFAQNRTQSGYVNQWPQAYINCTN